MFLIVLLTMLFLRFRDRDLWTLFSSKVIYTQKSVDENHVKLAISDVVDSICLPIFYMLISFMYLNTYW